VQRQEFDFGHHRLHAEKLQEELNGTRKQWLEMRQKNRDDEAAMRKKRSKIENELEAWITKYDTEMEEKQNEIDDLTVLYTEEKANLNELEARYSALSAEWAEIEKERAIKEEKRKASFEFCIFAASLRNIPSLERRSRVPAKESRGHPDPGPIPWLGCPPWPQEKGGQEGQEKEITTEMDTSKINSVCIVNN
jgi:hypothetical protein